MTTRPITPTIPSILDRIRYRVTHTRNEGPAIDPADAFNVLSSGRRRHAIKYIATQDHDDSILIGDLAGFIAVQENDCSIDADGVEEKNQ